MLAEQSQSLDLSIIIVSWNVADLLQDCLNSIVNSNVSIDQRSDDELSVEVIVIDSASNDNTVNMVRENFPFVRLFAQTENVGFTRGNNIGLEQATGRHLLLLNPDTEIIDGALQHLVHFLDKERSVGVIGPHTLNTDGTTQSSRRQFPTIALAFFESTWLQNFAPKHMLDHYYVANQPDDGVYDVDWVQGSALMARREVYEQIGGLDTGYIMFSEELDWCKRAKDAGWRVVYYGKAQITHHGGKSTEQVVANKHIYFQQSKLRYFRKFHGRVIATLLRIHLLIQYVFQIAIESIKSFLGSKREVRRARIKAYWQVLRSGLRTP